MAYIAVYAINPFFPPSGLVTGSCNGLHLQKIGVVEKWSTGMNMLRS